jgi:hypothetical protein
MGDSYAYSSHHWIFYREHNTSLKGAHGVSPPVNNTTRIHTIFFAVHNFVGWHFRVPHADENDVSTTVFLHRQHLLFYKLWKQANTTNKNENHTTVQKLYQNNNQVSVTVVYF